MAGFVILSVIRVVIKSSLFKSRQSLSGHV